LIVKNTLALIVIAANSIRTKLVPRGGISLINRAALVFCILSFTTSAVLVAQSQAKSSWLDASLDPSLPGPMADPATADGGGGQVLASPLRGSLGTMGPLSRFALGGGVSTIGINLQAAINLNRLMNLRTSGNYFNYTVSNITTNGFTVGAKLNFASAGASVDFYPFPNHGFRLSPGALFYNHNAATATFTVAGGTSFTLNDTTYYASASNPVLGNGSLGLHKQNPAFTATTGWGNMIPRKGGHWSFPFEIGAAFTGAPTLNIALTSGQICDAQGQNCVNVATDASVQTNLAAQVAKYTKDLNVLGVYPIMSGGLAYSFRSR
jgi:hypothetical protein